jgi:hypothetical protein
MSNLLIGLFLGILLGLAIPPFYKWIVNTVTKKGGAGMVLLFMLLTIGLASCGKTTGDPMIDNITFSQAWGHVAGFASYWVWLILSAVPLVLYIAYIIVDKNSELKLPILAALLAIFLFGLLYAPAECAANTTIEQAARGVFIR